MKHLYFCRHGQSELGKVNLWAGTTDSPLSAEGREQAKAAGVVAKQFGIDYIICSPLSRAYDTAEIIAREIGFSGRSIEVNPLVTERDFGSLEGKPWDPEFDVDTIADAESSAALLQRARETWEYLQTLPAENILLVSHGSFGRALRSIIHPDMPFNTKHRFQNAEIMQLL